MIYIALPLQRLRDTFSHREIMTLDNFIFFFCEWKYSTYLFREDDNMR